MSNINRNLLGAQVPDGSDHAPFRLSHTEETVPEVAPVQVAAQLVWLLQPPDGHDAPSGVVPGTPVHPLVAAGGSSCTAGQK